MQQEVITCTKSFYIGFTSTEVQKLVRFKWIEKIIWQLNENLVNPMGIMVMPVFYHNQALSMLTIEIGQEQAPFAVFVYYFPHLNMQNTSQQH